MDAAVLDELLGGSAREREESWRYSRNALRALTQQEFATAPVPTQLPADLLQQFDWPETRAARLVFVNGAYSQALSGTRIEIAHDANNHCELNLPHDLGQALHIVYVSVPGATPSRWQMNTRIGLGRGRASIIEQHVGVGGAEVFAAATSQFVLERDTELSVTTISDLPDSCSLYRRQTVSVQAGARYRCTHALAGGRLQRFDLACDLAQADARCEQRGVFALRGRAHIDVQLDVRHAARDTASDVLWRGVADQRARGILRGAITVAAGADGSDAQLQTKNLLLSPHAEIDAQPVLEIYADEVKAAHGATVGQLDERALFYMRSRGIAAVTARALLIAGFCREAFGAIDDTSLRAQLDAWLVRHLPLAGDAA